MSQWGAEITVNGARFMPVVDTQPFVPVAADSSNLIDEIICVDDGGNKETAENILAELKDRYVGGEYSSWLKLARQNDTQAAGTATTQDALDQLTRYGTGVASEEILSVLWKLTEINDNVAHGRDASLVRKTCEEAKHLLDRVIKEYESI